MSSQFHRSCVYLYVSIVTPFGLTLLRDSEEECPSSVSLPSLTLTTLFYYFLVSPPFLSPISLVEHLLSIDSQFFLFQFVPSLVLQPTIETRHLEIKQTLNHGGTVASTERLQGLLEVERTEMKRPVILRVHCLMTTTLSRKCFRDNMLISNK